MAVVNAKMQGMETAYVENGVSASDASTIVGQAVIDSVLEKNGTNIGKATIEIEQEEINNVKGNASISIYTTDFVVDGTITLEDGILTWGEIEPNVPSIKIINAPITLSQGENVILQIKPKGLPSNIEVSWESSNSEIISVNSTTGDVKGENEGTATIIASATDSGITYTAECTITILKGLSIGDSVDYTTTSNGQELKNWKVFYKEGSYVYLIYGDYLPNSAIGTITGIKTSGTYVVYAQNGKRTDLLNAMDKANWDSLLTGTLNKGKIEEKIVNETRSENVWAMGCPTLDLYISSWNTEYSSNKIYTDLTVDNMSDGLKGEYLKEREPVGKSGSANMSSTQGYLNTLYYPHREAIDEKCFGYWFASPAGYADNWINGITYNGYASAVFCGNDSYANSRAFRPIICLPSSVLK